MGMEVSLNPYCLDAGALPVTLHTTEESPEQPTETGQTTLVGPRVYDQLVTDAWRLNDAGYPRLAERALAEAGIRIHFDGDGR